MKKVMGLIGILLMSSFAVLSIDAKTTVKNSSDNAIKVYFQAYGCAGVSDGIVSYVCKSAKVEPRQGTSYKWKWGQTSKQIWIKDEQNGIWKNEISSDDDIFLEYPRDFDFKGFHA